MNNPMRLPIEKKYGRFVQKSQQLKFVSKCCELEMIIQNSNLFSNNIPRMLLTNLFSFSHKSTKSVRNIRYNEL